MLAWKTAIARALARTPVLPERRVRLHAAAGFVLAEPLIARTDSPRFDVAAVDGFAIHPTDASATSDHRPVRLRLTATVHAGDVYGGQLTPGTTVKIMTGAPVPRGAGAVVMREFCREDGAMISVCRTVTRGENIRPRGSEFPRNQRVLPPGVLITPPVVGLLATFGYATVRVYERPAITVVATGDELLSPSERLRPGKIRDANSHALAAAVRSLGIDPRRVFRVPDSRGALRRQLAKAVRNSDVLLIVGGLSVGDRDHVRAILGEVGVREQFWRVAVKPGKPAYFGRYVGPSGRRGATARSERRPGCLVFGLPGNPVSALVCFHQLVKPVLWRMMGRRSLCPLPVTARLTGDRRKPRGRLEWLRGVLYDHKGLRVRLLPRQESHMLGELAEANCLIRFPEDAEQLADGAEVTVEVLSWRE